MGITPIAVSISGLLGDVAVVAGIGAALASAILATVVLGQGREVRRLQDELDAETNRAHSAESALAVEVASVGRIAVAPAASAPAAQTSVKPVAVPAEAAAPVAEIEVEELADGPGFTGPEISSGSPALGSATMAPVIAARVALAEVESEGADDDDTDHQDDTVDETVGGGQALTDRAAPIVIPSPVPAAPADPVLGQPATAAAGGLGRTPNPPQPLSGGAKRRSPLIVALLGLVAAGAVVFGLTQVLGGSESSSPTKTSPSAGGGGDTSSGRGAIVAVLNGTPINGLAGQVAAELAKDGFRKGRTATASNQQQANTVVAYMPGHAVDAEDVAKALGVKGNVVAADDKVQAIACPDPNTCTAEVIVTVGADSTR
jgi:hypothetical protein